MTSRRGSYGAGLDRTRGTAARTEVASRTDALNGKMQATPTPERLGSHYTRKRAPACRMFVRPFRVTSCLIWKALMAIRTGRALYEGATPTHAAGFLELFLASWNVRDRPFI